MSEFSDELIQRLSDADRVAVLTGAGVSAESGISTFRDPDGLWEEFSPQELANVDAFLENTELVQGWYHHRREITREADPNAAHKALAEMERIVPEFTLITQNVDDLHNRAGSKNVLELHGNITRNYCIECEEPAADEDLASLADGEPAVCTHCGGFIRPDVVWFGERLPVDAIRQAEAAAERCDVFLSVGTSAVVFPAAGLPLTAKQNGAYVAEFNVNRTDLSPQVHEVILGKAGEMLPELVKRAFSERNIEI